jgi:hypothetical protein
VPRTVIHCVSLLSREPYSLASLLFATPLRPPTRYRQDLPPAVARIDASTTIDCCCRPSEQPHASTSSFTVVSSSTTSRACCPAPCSSRSRWSLCVTMTHPTSHVLTESRVFSSLDHPFVSTLYTTVTSKIWVGDKGERKRAHYRRGKDNKYLFFINCDS